MDEPTVNSAMPVVQEQPQPMEPSVLTPPSIALQQPASADPAAQAPAVAEEKKGFFARLFHR
jgi:hypothetical protein